MNQLSDQERDVANAIKALNLKSEINQHFIEAKAKEIIAYNAMAVVSKQRQNTKSNQNQFSRELESFVKYAAKLRNHINLMHKESLEVLRSEKTDNRPALDPIKLDIDLKDYVSLIYSHLELTTEGMNDFQKFKNVKTPERKITIFIGDIYTQLTGELEPIKRGGKFQAFLDQIFEITINQIQYPDQKGIYKKYRASADSQISIYKKLKK